MTDPYGASRAGTGTSAFWDGLAEGTFLLQRCDDCGHLWFPPTGMCPACHSIRFRLQPAGGGGTIWTVTRVEHALRRELEAEVPYWLVVVQLDEGPKVLGRLTTARSDADAAIGLPVRIQIDKPRKGEAECRYRYHFEAVTRAPE